MSQEIVAEMLTERSPNHPQSSITEMSPIRHLIRPATLGVRSGVIPSRSAYSSIAKEAFKTRGSARESAGESKRTAPSSVEKIARMDAQSEQSQQGMKEHAKAETQSRGGQKKDYKKEFLESPGIIGMEDQVGGLESRFSFEP